RADCFPVKALVGVAVRSERGAVERYAGENSRSPGIGQNVSVARTRARSRTGRCRRVGTNFYLAVQHLVHGRWRHYEQDVIGGRAAELHTGTSATDGVHSGR